LEEIILKESKQTNIMARLFNFILLSENIIEIFAETTKQLSLMIKCDFVNMLLNNEKSRYFYINQALAQNNIDHEYEIIIPYNETSITEIIRSHRSIVRNDLSGRGELTPGDLKFLAEGIKSDLSVPIICKDKVPAIINLSSYESNYFTESNISQTEQIASLLGLALERAELFEKLNKKQSDLLLWKNKFNSLINNVNEAIAIVRLDYDLIYDTNTAFQKLTGYSSEELQGMRLSHLHPQQKDLILSKLDKCRTNGKVSDTEKIILNCKDGVTLPVKLRFVDVDGNTIKFVFAIYEKVVLSPSSFLPLNEIGNLSYDLIKLQQSVFNEINRLANSDLEFNEFIPAVLLAIKKVVNFDYAQISLFDDTGENLVNHTIISDRCREYDKQTYWNILEGCDLYWYNISKQNLRYQVKKNILNPIEHELQSRIPEVLITKNRYSGTLVLGCLEPNFYQKYQTEFIKQIAEQIATLIENINLSSEHKKRMLNIAVQSELIEMIGINLNIKNVLSSIVKLSAEKMKAQLATIQLIENDTLLLDIVVSDTKCDKSLIMNFEKEIIFPKILKSNKSYVIENIKHYKSNQWDKTLSELFGYLTIATIPLKSDEKMIGILSNYWNKIYQLTAEDYCLLDTIAFQASVAIDNAKLHQDSICYSDRLEMAKHELEKYVNSISHELKTSLASIQGFSSILLDNLKEEINDETFNYLQKIKSKAAKSQRYIENLHEFARVDQNVQPFEEVNLSDIVEQARNKLLDTIELKKITIIIDKELPNMYCDRNLLLQVFINLIVNAIKNLGENNKKPKIEIGYRNSIGNEMFFVRNNGMGISKEFHEDIFDLLHPIENDEDVDEGYGLGLAIAKKIIEIHDGQIWFESEENKGSTFYFSLPKRKFRSFQKIV